MSTSNCVPLCIRKQQTEQIINMEETHLKAQESEKNHFFPLAEKKGN